MLSQRLRRDLHFYKYLHIILSFIFLASAAIALLTTPLPDGPWIGMYQAYAPTWILFLLGVIFMLVSIKKGVSWKILTLFGTLSVGLVVSLSLQWGFVYGPHDPWTHYYYVNFEILDFSKNPYPGFHSGVIAAGNILGFSGTSVLRYTALIASLIGASGLALLLRRLCFSQKASQYAYVAGLPAILKVFIQPFALAWPYAIFIAWGVFASVERKRTLVVLLLVGGLLTIIHPQLPFFSSTFFLAGFLTVVIKPYLPDSYNGITLSLSIRNFIGLIGGYAIIVSGYMLLLTDTGPRLLDNLSDHVSEFLDQSTTQGESTPTPPESESTPTPPESESTPTPPESESTPTPPESDVSTPSGVDYEGKSSLIVKLIENPASITEAVARLTYVLMLSTAAGASIIKELRERSLIESTLVFSLATAQFGIFFLFVDLVLNSQIVSVNRGIRMIPLVLVPATVYSLRVRSSSGYAVGAVLALLILTGGLVIVFPSDYTGGVAQTATNEQVAGVQWIGEYNHLDRPVAGGTMTFWIARGLHGEETIAGWTTNENYAPTRVATRRNGYAWQIRDPVGLTVIDSVSQALARQEAQETDDLTALRELETMPIRQSKVYTNGGTEIYSNESAIPR